jgi:aldehyde dehydrogenase (NAD+)
MSEPRQLAAAPNFRALFEEQQRLYRERPFPSLAERLQRLERLERAIRARRGEIARALRADFGKSADETELTETIFTLGELRHARARLAKWMKPRSVRTPAVVWGSRSEIRPEPRGVVLIMAPFNYPFQLAMVPLSAALAAGNRAIVRVSEKAPHARAVVAAIVAEAFAPQEVATVGGEIDAAQALLALPFDHIFFTGSTAVGKIVMAAAARHLASVTLELGGKSPALVCEDADPSLAAARIAWGKCLNAGQTCIAPDYALVHESQADAFVRLLGTRFAKMYGASDAARARTPDFCRLIDDGAFARVAGLIDASVAAGARIAFGGERDATQRYLAPTVVTHVDWHMPLMAQEIFGPVLPVVTYRSLDAALAQIARRPKPLALYVFANSRATIETVLRATSAGSTLVNDTLLQWTNHHLPMGGIGPSGQGGYHGVHGFRAFSHERAIMRQTRLSAAPLLAPPFGGVSRALTKALERLT